MDTGNHWEFIFLGTGPSQTVPDISCLLTGRDCKACKSALNEAGSKNRRLNTSGIVKIYTENTN